MGIACNNNNANLNSAHHSWKTVKHVINHHRIEIMYHHIEYIIWILSIVT